MDAVRAMGECDAYQAGRAQGWDLAGQVGDRVGSRCRVRGWYRGSARPDTGSARTAFARQVAMYLAHVGCGVSLTEVGHLFERDRTTVAHACGLVEDRRDDPDFDYRLNHLERAVSCLLDALSMRQGRG